MRGRARRRMALRMPMWSTSPTRSVIGEMGCMPLRIRPAAALLPAKGGSSSTSRQPGSSGSASSFFPAPRTSGSGLASCSTPTIRPPSTSRSTARVFGFVRLSWREMFPSYSADLCLPPWEWCLTSRGTEQASRISGLMTSSSTTRSLDTRL